MTAVAIIAIAALTAAFGLWFGFLYRLARRALKEPPMTAPRPTGGGRTPRRSR